jgi:hypothetical protein
MGRPPIGKRAMTAAERQQRHRRGTAFRDAGAAVTKQPVTKPDVRKPGRKAKPKPRIKDPPIPSPDDEIYQDDCADCETPEQFWVNSLGSLAGDAISMRSYWTRMFGNWESFGVSTSLITLAEQAADEWIALAKFLRSKRGIS